MTRRERLLATLRGEPVDRPAVSFYEIGGIAIDPADPDPYNIYHDLSWRPLLQLAEEQTDLIWMRAPAGRPVATDTVESFLQTREEERDEARFIQRTITIGGRTLTSVSRRDRDIDTVWVLEHLLKDTADLEAYLALPDEWWETTTSVANLVEAEEQLGDRGIVMVDTPDPLCQAAALFSMEDFTTIAFTERDLFHRLLQKLAGPLQARTEQVAGALPGRLWRIYGPEYASEPFLPNELFQEYVVRYTGPMVTAIERHGGFARIHCHGHIRRLLPHFVAMGATATDPCEPPPQGDISLGEIRREYGKDLVLFGNLEITDIENLAPDRFAKVVAQSLADGVGGTGFVLMPSAAPYGRTITRQTLANYETMVRLVQAG